MIRLFLWQKNSDQISGKCDISKEDLRYQPEPETFVYGARVLGSEPVILRSIHQLRAHAYKLGLNPIITDSIPRLGAQMAGLNTIITGSNGRFGAPILVYELHYGLTGSKTRGPCTKIWGSGGSRL